MKTAKTLKIMKTLTPDRVFYKTMLAIALPIALQNLIGSLLNMVDTIMIGQLGETEIASVGLANQVTFLLHLFLFGVSSGSAIFTAQYWGVKDIVNIRRILGLGLLCALLISSLFLVAGSFFPSFVLGLFSRDTTVVDLGSRYLSIVAPSFAMMAVSFTFASVLRSTGQARLPMYISATALLVNTGLNYGLILGQFGLPALGVQGAAIATLIARSIELLLFIGIIYGRKLILAARPRELLGFHLDYVRKFLRTTLPVVLNESLWAVGVTLYVVVYARMGTDVVASINIASTIERLAMVIFFGIASSAAVMLGNLIGAGDENKAFRYAIKFALLGPLIGIVSGLVLILLSPAVLTLFRVSDAVTASARSILLIYGLMMPARVFNIINIVGILRSGGDTRFTLFIDTAGVWLIAVPLAFLGGLVWQLPIEQVVMLIIIEEIFKMVLGIWRMRSRKWINRLTGHDPAQHHSPGHKAAVTAESAVAPD